MYFYEIDLQGSKQLYEEMKNILEPNMCYNNTFQIVDAKLENFTDGPWRVAYGYVEAAGGAFCRHCFVLDTTTGRVLDPTAFCGKSEVGLKKYCVTKVFDDVHEYFDAIADEHNLPALNRTLQKEDSEAAEAARENGYIFI